jgi:hypothetical protein
MIFEQKERKIITYCIIPQPKMLSNFHSFCFNSTGEFFVLLCSFLHCSATCGNNERSKEKQKKVEKIIESYENQMSQGKNSMKNVSSLCFDIFIAQNCSNHVYFCLFTLMIAAMEPSCRVIIISDGWSVFLGV